MGRIQNFFIENLILVFLSNDRIIDQNYFRFFKMLITVLFLIHEFIQSLA